jgi:hypothetical protein
MKKKIKLPVFILILSFFLFFNCNSSKTKTINILTDDISLYEVIDAYNLKNLNTNVSIEYLSDRSSNIFKYIEEKRYSNFDLIVGEYNPALLVNINSYVNINHKIKEINDNRINYFKPCLDFIEKYDGILIPYSINFPVIIARKDVLSQELLKLSELSINDFCDLVKRTNRKDPNEQYNQIFISFIPLISKTEESDFYTILNETIFIKNEKIILDTEKAARSFDFYNNFDNTYNFGKETTKKYLDRYDNVNKNFYLKQKIISFDIIPVSDALTFPEENYKIFYIKDLKNLSLKSKVIAVPKSSINLKEVLSFIDYLTNKDAQEKMTANTLSNTDYYGYIHFPIIKNIINNKKILITDSKKMEDYADNLKYFNFYNQKFQRKYFQKYQYAKDLISKGQIQDKDFINVLAKELIK